jgi:hypothetical protein
MYVRAPKEIPVFSDQARGDTKPVNRASPAAKPLFLEVLEVKRRVFGDGNVNTAYSLYDLACLSALQGERAEAMSWLGQAVDAGWADADLTIKDSTLETLHGPQFDSLVEQVRRNASEMRADEPGVRPNARRRRRPDAYCALIARE